MRNGVWFIRIIFAAWMIPAGLNHFIPLFPQPMGAQPLSQELILALIDSDLFALVKAVELIAGVCLLFGFYTPLALLICLPVSFCVFYYDAPLEGWGSRAAHFGYATLLCNVLLCIAYFKDYRSMFPLRAEPSMKQIALAGRIVFGLWMLFNGLNYLFVSFWSMPTGQEPLAIQLMSSLVNSRLLDVAMVIQVVAGALIISGVFIPVALALLMPISSCALFWAVILNQQPLYAALSIVAFAINGLLMLAYLPYYKDALQKHALALGETNAEHMNYEAIFISPKGSIPRTDFIPALITALAAMAFFIFLVTGRTAHFCVLIILYPTFILLAQRLQDMGVSAWLAVAPAVLALLSMTILLSNITLGLTFDNTLYWIALAVSAGFMLWGCVAQSKQSS